MERNLTWLSVGDHRPMQIWITASLVGLHINLDQTGASSESASIEVDLFTDVDRSAAAHLFDRGRFSALEQQLPPTPPPATLSLDIHGFPETVRMHALSAHLSVAYLIFASCFHLASMG